MILPYQDIKALCSRIQLVTPCVERTVSNGMTYGLGPAGYDVRIAQDLIVHPGMFRLASIMEHMSLPAHILGQVCDKSTWARRGLAVQNTIIEPGWSGYLTLELTNHSQTSIRLLKGMPICQIIFMELSRPTSNPYDGKYQNQPEGPVAALLE